jgi:chitinase
LLFTVSTGIMALPKHLVILLSFFCYGFQYVLGSAFHSHHYHHKNISARSSPDSAYGALLPRASTTSISGQDGYTCGPGNPCSNGACCGESGWCGYGPTYCGDGCQSNCNATADCGQYAATSGQTCPLNVCCSEYGFCGTTSE